MGSLERHEAKLFPEDLGFLHRSAGQEREPCQISFLIAVGMMIYGSAKTDSIIEGIGRAQKKHGICGVTDFELVGSAERIVDGGANAALHFDSAFTLVDSKFDFLVLWVPQFDELVFIGGPFFEPGLEEQLFVFLWEFRCQSDPASERSHGDLSKHPPPRFRSRGRMCAPDKQKPNEMWDDAFHGFHHGNFPANDKKEV
ncbi:MAG: hypothetical protein KDM63_08160 [Verrucomicrobiae bacterium]|nr:hypothetical protein [Verrucomicrobiae bacterium]